MSRHVPRGPLSDETRAKIGAKLRQYRRDWRGRIIPGQKSGELPPLSAGEWRALPSDTAIVYFMSSGRLVKIGTTARPEARLRALVTMSPERLELVAWLPGGERLESQFHERFADLREHGEWFRVEGELRLWLERWANPDADRFAPLGELLGAT